MFNAGYLAIFVLFVLAQKLATRFWVLLVLYCQIGTCPFSCLPCFALLRLDSQISLFLLVIAGSDAGPLRVAVALAAARFAGGDTHRPQPILEHMGRLRMAHLHLLLCSRPERAQQGRHSWLPLQEAHHRDACVPSLTPTIAILSRISLLRQ